MTNRNANSSAPIPMPTQNPKNSFPAWRFPNGMMNASDAQLESASSSCGYWEWGCAGLVLIGIIGEFVIAYAHPPYDSFWNHWGITFADAAIAVGIVGEVIFGRLDARIQTELRARSNKQLADAEKDAAEANAKTEQLRTANLELQRILEPRRIVMGSRDGDRDTRAPLFEALKEFAGTRAFVQAVPDFEAQTLAADIMRVLQQSGWIAQFLTTEQSGLAPGWIQEGVHVEAEKEFPGFPFVEGGPNPTPMPPPSRAELAAQTLVNLLSLDLPPRFWGVMYSPDWRYNGTADLPTLLKQMKASKNDVAVLVGLRPLRMALAGWQSRMKPKSPATKDGAKR